jgi:hypothetical protein
MKSLSSCGADGLPQHAEAKEKMMQDNCAGQRICQKVWRKIEASAQAKRAASRRPFRIDIVDAD